MPTIDEVLRDLIAEQDALDAIVAPLEPDAWNLDTASDRWTVADQIAHLTYFDDAAAQAIEHPDAFEVHRDQMVRLSTDQPALDDATVGTFRHLSASDRLIAWREARARLARAAAQLGDDDRVNWYGPSMGARSFLTARLMETWAHGQDIVDALEKSGHPGRRVETDRLRHIAQLGVITRDWSYRVRGATPPDGEVVVELIAPSGAVWRWGPDEPVDEAGADTPQRVSGSAVGFCQVVTQRRNIADTDVQAVGDDAAWWMHHAQAFAGPPTLGPRPGSSPQSSSAAPTDPSAPIPSSTGGSNTTS